MNRMGQGWSRNCGPTVMMWYVQEIGRKTGKWGLAFPIRPLIFKMQT